jgi:hypothetical protein
MQLATYVTVSSLGYFLWLNGNILHNEPKCRDPILTCDKYKCSLRHMHDPVLSSLKMKSICLPFFTMPRIIVMILRNIARLIFRQFAVVRYQLSLGLFVFKFIFSCIMSVCSELLHSRFTGGYKKAPTIIFYWPVNVCLRGGSSWYEFFFLGFPPYQQGWKRIA